MRKLLRRDEVDAREDGFTLVEMVVAIAVLAATVLAVSGVLESGLRSLAAAKARARANQIATEGIEDLQRFAFNNLGLCDAPSGTPPAGLETLVTLPNCPAAPAYVNPCQPGVVGNVPKAEYPCVVNNITYTVKRYVAWSDALRATKRLAVFVEWTDLVGNHQVSQQSSLRVPDQAAITGLAPPTFTNQPLATPSQSPLSIDGDRRLVSSSTIQLHASTSNLRIAATGSLSTTSIPAHQPTDQFDIVVSNHGAFPNYNGFPVTITGGGNSESFVVLAGAGSPNWRVEARGASAFSPGATILFTGDRVYALLRTLAGNGSPQTSTVFLTSSDGSTWTAALTRDSHPTFTFGEGAQYVAFGIVRAADGKTSGAFASTSPTFCPATLGCSPLSQPEVTPVLAPSTVTLGSSGELVNDISFEVSTKNVTSADTVTLSFLTRSGTITVALQPKAGTTCPGPDTATTGVVCSWTGTVTTTEGHSFSPGSQNFYFAAQQVLDTVNPVTIDKGSTGVASPRAVTFA